MSRYVLALGSNLDDRRQNLTQCLESLKTFSSVLQVSPLFETAPLLPDGAPAEWYKFFLNAVVEVESSLSAHDLLKRVQEIEKSAGRNPSRQRWSPRALDIDLLFNAPLTPLKTDELTLPHPQWSKRSFVISPLVQMTPSLAMPDDLLGYFRSTKGCQPALMAVLNLTPDSFSSSDPEKNSEHQLTKFKELLEMGAAYIDIGAESTRPGATALSDDEEWQRLEAVLHYWKSVREKYPFTRLSLDTYHAKTAGRALDFRVDILNDVNHLQWPQMSEIAQNYESVVLMHSLSVPADKNIVLPAEADAVETLRVWISEKMNALKNIKTSQIIFDPGLGFGKTARQSLEIIRRFNEFDKLPVRRLVGHSRKSFLSIVSDRPAANRDVETQAMSIALFEKRCEILRVHNFADHQQAFKAYAAGFAHDL